MIRNYLLVAFRNVLKNKVFSFINITGLAIGMACSILILLWVMNELSYDQFHDNRENIFRVIVKYEDQNGKLLNLRRMPYPFGDAMKEEIPEVVNVTRFSRGNRVPIIKDDISFYENTVIYANPSILDIFSFPLVKGDKENLFNDIRSVVITERWAKKYFGDENPIGKKLNWNNWQMFTVQGVIKDIPENSHINFDLITRFDIWKKSWPPSFSWKSFEHNIYVELQQGANTDDVERKMQSILLSHVEENKSIKGIFLQPLTDIHLTTNIHNEYAKIIDKEYLYIYSLIAAMILIIACINYINLSTARSVKRSMEIGIRKTLGAERKRIIGQFMAESFLTTFMAYILAMMSVEFFLPSFNSLVGKNIEVEYLNPYFLSVVFTILFLTTLIAGGYPAFYLSAVKPVKVLKGMFTSSKLAGKFRKALVTIQFSVSVLLITGTIGIYLQMEYISSKKLGFDKEGVVYLPVKGDIGKKYEVFKKDLLNNSNVISVSIKNSIPISNQIRGSVDWDGNKSSSEVIINYEKVGYDYFNTMGINLITGRDFSLEHSLDDENSVIIDESTAELMQLANPVGQIINLGEFEMKIVGVINKTNFLSLRTQAEPRVYILVTDYSNNNWNLEGVILIKINTNEINSAVAKIENSWKKINPKIPVDLKFLDETYSHFYQSEKQTINTLAYFTFLAVFISCMGLFGLVTFTLEQKRKEIAIRKTFGASDRILVWGFLKSFSSLVIYAFLIAVGPAYYLLYNWLKGFAYHVTPGPELFIGVGSILLTITLVTVGFNSLRAARANPVNNLRDE